MLGILSRTKNKQDFLNIRITLDFSPYVYILQPVKYVIQTKTNIKNYWINLTCKLDI